jgi:hypothetical protein
VFKNKLNILPLPHWLQQMDSLLIHKNRSQPSIGPNKQTTDPKRQQTTERVLHQFPENDTKKITDASFFTKSYLIFVT